MALRTDLTATERMRLGWGRLRRMYLATFRPAYVRASIARRLGDCNRTGACCHLMFTCPILDVKSEPVRCRIQAHKPSVCKLFPIDERDLRDRDIISPDAPCGFSFLPPEEAPARPGKAAGDGGTGGSR